MWAEYQAIKEIILRDCVFVFGWELSTKETRTKLTKLKLSLNKGELIAS